MARALLSGPGMTKRKPVHKVFELRNLTAVRGGITIVPEDEIPPLVEEAAAKYIGETEKSRWR